MQSRTVERIEEWGTRPFAGGIEGLRELADQGFTGAIDADPWVFMLDGRVVGVLGGTVDESGPGTAYAAPHDSVALLFVMLERGGERRGRYYTGETPIADVDETLREGGFTGYLELSENVLSGDYYLVYHGGERRACAFVGQAERLYTGDEAYERAVDEVGIYTVTAVEVGVVDLPGRGPGETDAAGTGDVDPLEGTRSGGVAGTDAESGSAVGGPDGSAASRSPGDSGPDPASESRSDSPASPSASGSSVTDSGPGVTDADVPGEGSSAGADTSPSAFPSSSSDPLEGVDAAGSTSGADAGPEGAGSRSGSAPSPAPPATRSGGGLRPAIRPVADVGSASDPGDESAPGSAGDRSAAADPSGADRSASPGTDADADRIEALRTERAELREENERLREELAAARERSDGLEAEVRRLEERVRDLQSGDDTERTLSLEPEEALSGTSLFVRYGDKGAATLADALTDESERETVHENLSLEHHTTFEDESAAVDGEPFEEFLRDSLAFGVASWLVREFPYEIVDTGHVDDLGGLYEAIPEIDRIELRGSVDVGDEAVGFDVVCRDRMGTPLVVVDLHESRDPAGAQEMDELLGPAGVVAEATETLAGAILVTASFFDPPSLETAREATAGGGLLGNGPTSFVRLSRRAGYHLCLVEARDGRFHVAMPEL